MRRRDVLMLLVDQAGGMSGTGTYLDELDDPEEESEWDNAETVENEAPLAGGPRGRTRPPFPTEAPEGYADWNEFFRTAKAIARGDDEEEIEEPVYTVLGARDGDVSDLLRGPKKVTAAALDLGWDVAIRVTDVYRPPVLFKTTNENHNRGDVRYEERRKTYWWIRARHPKAALGFLAAYTETETAKGGRGFSFDHARAADPAGVPVELFHEYAAGKASKVDKRETATSVEARQRQMDDQAARAHETYNDGADYLEHQPLFKGAKAFETWMADWTALLEPNREDESE